MSTASSACTNWTSSTLSVFRKGLQQLHSRDFHLCMGKKFTPSGLLGGYPGSAPVFPAAGSYGEGGTPGSSTSQKMNNPYNQHQGYPPSQVLPGYNNNVTQPAPYPGMSSGAGAGTYGNRGGMEGSQAYNGPAIGGVRAPSPGYPGVNVPGTTGGQAGYPPSSSTSSGPSGPLATPAVGAVPYPPASSHGGNLQMPQPTRVYSMDSPGIYPSLPGGGSQQGFPYPGGPVASGPPNYGHQPTPTYGPQPGMPAPFGHESQPGWRQNP